MMALSLSYDMFWGGFRPLYRGRFLGSLVTRYVGHSSKACQSGRARQAKVDGHPEKTCWSPVVRLTTRVS